ELVQTMISEHSERMRGELSKYSPEEVQQINEAAKNTELRQDIHIAVLNEPNSEQVVMYLLQNPQEAARLNSLPGGMAYRQVERIADRLANGRSNGNGHRPVPVSRAPAPIKPVGSNSTRTSVPLDEMSFRDYR